MKSMNASPAISSDVLVHRGHEMQRSRSSSTWVEMATGLSKVRCCSANLVSPWPLDMAWFCSGHSPPLSHIGQSSGWLMSRNSITPCCALSATAEVSWVWTTMPSLQGVVQEPRDLDAEQLGGPDDQLALRHRDLEPVDRDGHRILPGLHRHVALP